MITTKLINLIDNVTFGGQTAVKMHLKTTTFTKLQTI